jgi:hypothetical protein
LPYVSFIGPDVTAVAIALTAIGTDVSPIMANIPSIMTNIFAIGLSGGWCWRLRRKSLPKRKQRGRQ